MTLRVKQSEFKSHMNAYLDQICQNDQIVYVSRTNNQSVAVMSQEKLYWMEKALQSEKDSIDYAIARDQLIQRHVLSDDPVTEAKNEYWGQFK